MAGNVIEFPRQEEDGNIWVGLFWGVLLSAPVWALIIWAVRR